MVNVSVTSTCNRKCSYCFAKDTMEHSQGAAMSLEQFDATLDFAERNGMSEARILGGEPTIHPQFVQFLDRALARNFRVLVFSGGLIPKVALKRMQQCPGDRLRVLLNVAMPGESPEYEVERQREVMSQLGDRVALGINIHSPGADLEWLLQPINEFQLARQVRLGLTHPMMSGDNAHLHPRYFEAIGSRVADFVRAARQEEVSVEFDCGWVPCMFPEGSLEELGIPPHAVGLRCNPILDVLPNGHVISCYPMAEHHREKLSDWNRVEDLASRFSERQAPLRPIGIFKRCAECSYREQGQCSGGCLSLSMQRLRNHELEVSLPSDWPIKAPDLGRYRLTVLNNGPAREPKSASCGCQAPCGDGGEPRVAIATSSISPRSNRERCSPEESGNPSLHIAPRLQEESTAPVKQPLWSVPYIDQPLEFWEEIELEFGAWIENVYLPLPGGPIGTGRPIQPERHAEPFLRKSALHKSVLINVTTLPAPVPQLAPQITEALNRVRGEYGVTRAVVANFQLARHLRDALPDFSLTASVLMEVMHPYQARLLNGICSTLVPGSGITRDLPALRAVKEAFHGRIRLLVNEACLPLCPYRAQHFREMAEGVEEPKSLCHELLAEQPWLRLTGSWVLPQHLHLLQDVADEWKLAGRVTLRHPVQFRKVLGSYIHRQKLLPNEIGGGPSSVLESIDVPEDLYRYTLECGRQCHQCTRCPDYYQTATVETHRRDLTSTSSNDWQRGGVREQF